MTLQKVNVCARPECDLPIRSRGLCNRHYELHRRRMLAYGRWESVRVDAAPVRDHYRALLDAGMHRNQISRLTGIAPSQLDNLLKPRKHRGDQPAKMVYRSTADRLLAVPVPAPHQAWRWAADGQPVHPAGTARRLQALVAIGWTNRELATRLEMGETNLTTAVHSHRWPTAGFARKVADLFDELQLTPGPSKRARLRAERNGWASPLAWEEDTIDDPDAAPTRDASRDATPSEEADPVAVDRGATWILTCPTWNYHNPAHHQWRRERPPMTRADRIAVAERLADQVSIGTLCTALSLRRADIDREQAA